MKKFFAFVIAAAMVLSLITVPAMAENKKAAADPRTTGTVPAVTRDAATLDEALNVPGGTLVFTNDATYPWIIVGDAAQSGNAGVSSSTSSVTTTVTAAEGDILQFDFKAWGEGSGTFWDHCDCYVDDTRVLYYGAHDNEAWETFAVALEAGEHTVTWSYTKDSSVNPTGDYFMVDNVYVGQPVMAEEITVEDISVPAGRRATVVYEVLPAAAYDKSVTFAVADTSIATVNANGVVTGVAEGTTTITVTSVAVPEVSGTATITVTEALPTVTLYGFDTYDMASNYDNMWIEFPDYDPTDYVGHASMSGNAWAAAFAGGNVYGYLYADGGGNNFFIMDPETFSVAYPGTNADNVSGILGMAYNHANDVMYGISGGDTRQLCTIDLATGVPTAVAPVSGMNTPLTFAISTDGVAYAIEYQTGDLYTIDLETAAATRIGATGVGAAYVQSMCFDHVTGQIFWAQILDGTTHGLYTINPETAEASFLGMIGPNGGEVTALYTKDEIEIAPIETPDVTVTFVDGVDNAVLDTMVVPAGTVLDENDFPTPPVHAGYEFTGWDYEGQALYTDTTITAQYHDPNSTIWDFETDPEAQGFQFVDQDGDGFNWTWHMNTGTGNHTTHGGDGVATSASYDNDGTGALTPDNWMITPEFEGTQLTFWLVAQDTSYANDYLEVYVTTDGGETWSEALWSGFSPTAYEQYTIDLSAYANRGPMKVAFRHFNCTDMFMMNIDDIEVSGGTEVPPTEPPTTEPPTTEPPTGQPGESIIWDFETDPEAQGFEFEDQDGDGNNWEWRCGDEWADFNYHEGLGYMMSASYINYVGALTPDNWMITPAFTGTELTFWAQGQDASYAEEYLGIFVSEDGGNTWSDEIIGYTLNGSDMQYTVDLSDYEGTEIRVAIRHYNVTDMFQANVDYIEVVGGGETPPTGILGDVDNDGDCDVADAILTLRYCMGIQDLTDEQLEVADVNGDGVVTIDDAILILRAAMGLITLE